MLRSCLGCAQAYLGVVTNKHNQGQAFALIGLTWGVGAVFGSAIGGMLGTSCAVPLCATAHPSQRDRYAFLFALWMPFFFH